MEKPVFCLNNGCRNLRPLPAPGRTVSILELACHAGNHRRRGAADWHRRFAFSQKQDGHVTRQPALIRHGRRVPGAVIFSEPHRSVASGLAGDAGHGNPARSAPGLGGRIIHHDAVRQIRPCSLSLRGSRPKRDRAVA